MKIKEKVEIKPEVNFSKIKGLNKTGGSSHTIKLDYDWQGATYSYDGVLTPKLRFRVSSCEGEDYSTEDVSGHVEYVTTATYGNSYNFTLEFAEWNSYTKSYYPWDWVGDTFYVYVDDELYTKFRGFGGIDPWYGYFDVDFAHYYYEGLPFGEAENIYYYRHHKCLPIIGWMNEDFPTLTLTEGNEYLSFYTKTSLDSLGDSFYGGDNYPEDDSPVAIYDKPYYGTAPINAILMGEVNGVVAYDTISILPVCDNHLTLKTEGDWWLDWIYPMEKVDIPLEVSCYDDISEIEGITFTAEVTEGSNFGGIINPATGRTTNKLTNIEHEDGSFEITFFSNGEKPAEDEDVKITVTASDPEIEPYDIEFYIHPSEFVIKFFPEELKQGETASVNFYRNETVEGENIPFPEGQLFNVEIFEGGDYVKLSSNDDDELYDNLTDVTQPVQLIANEDIDLDTVQVVLFAETNDNGGTQPAAASTSVNGAESLGKVTNGSKVKTKSKSKRRRKGWGYGKKGRGVRITKKSTEKEIKAGNELAEKADKGKEEVKYSQSFVKGNNNKQTATPVITGTADEDDENWIGATGEINVVSEIEILLGETKYFAVKKKSDEYKIVEIPTEYGDEPKWSNVTLSDGWEWLKEDVWGNNPIEKLGTKSGVYWEKKYPFYTNNKFSEMKDLDVGIIRIVGRYWEQDKEDDYKVKLKETNGSDIILKIIKPKTIGEKKDKLLDVKGNEYNLDELILKYAGLNGVPPQIIKGIIKKESNFENAYRWEPFFEVRSAIHKVNDDDIYVNWTQTDSRYTIKNDVNIGDPGIPADHTNVNGAVNYPNHYWGYQGSVWDLFYQNCKLVNPYAERDLYPPRNKNGKWLWSKKEYDKWSKKKKNVKNIYNKNLKKSYDLGIITDEQFEELKNGAEDYARNIANNFMRENSYHGKMMEIAQTRIASSYGLMQVLYTTATWLMDYPEDYYKNSTPETATHLPEFLNERETTLIYGSNAISKYVKMEVDYKNDKWDENWDKGYERTYEIGLYCFNHGRDENRYKKKDYGYDVLKYSILYLPEN